MNKIFPFLLSVSFLSACGNNKADQPFNDKESAEVIVKKSWVAALNDSSGNLEMKKVETTGPDSLAVPAVVSFVNTQYPNVQLVFIKTSGDTAYLKIPEATYLTQQMGSTGSMIYMAQTIYNLTEIPGIKYVNLDFEEGDHASPGTFSRESFKDE